MLLALALLACTPASDQDPDDVHGELVTIDGLQVLRLQGSRYEMGYAEGSMFCDEMTDLMEVYLLDTLMGEYAGVPYEIVQAMAQNTIELDEGDYNELEGLYQGALDHCTEEQLTVTSEFLEADAGGSRRVTFEDLVIANTIADFGCSSFSAWGDATVHGDTIYGRNFDWAVDVGGQYLQWHLLKVYDDVDAPGAVASLSVPGFIGCISCFNEDGIGMLMHNVYGGADNTTPTGNDPRTLAVRRALVATLGAEDPVAVAEASLESRPLRSASILHMPMPISIHEPVVLEVDGDEDHADGQVTVRRAGDYPAPDHAQGLVNTNHYVTRRPPIEDDDSAPRYDTLAAGVSAALTAPLDMDAGDDLIGEVGMWATAHSITYDAYRAELWVHIAPEYGTPANTAEPHVVTFEELFDR